ncbi:MAG TPA: hypothetical protein VMB50_02715 [Myxococcales bacterium]|nr:hypothetical protein [Myxococcales bacterium]
MRPLITSSLVIGLIVGGIGCGKSGNGEGCGQSSDCASGFCDPHPTPLNCTAEDCFGTCEPAPADAG